MPAIKPISDLRNYTELLKDVDKNQRVYLTRNGRGAYTIMTMEESEKLDRLSAYYDLLADLMSAEERASKEGWISSEEMERELGLNA